ncbi:hypothetical protein HUJ04_006649 [Dendroctonus ponderosae]|nr:hypothetical protein HUJ04_003292 [Dendroctonus ponderosae]KAH1005719.1 hypothetical protein HUJ04_006649 [Dendroctonus ponderosae]KAH1012827.1 hypothetical protein HUJ05_011913 [Dendroctonus ponderosae]
MNGTMFFDSINTRDQSLFASMKPDSGEVRRASSKLDINDEFVAVPCLELISKGYDELKTKIEQDDNKEETLGLYRPIPTHNDDDYSPYGYRNSPAQDVLKFQPDNDFIHLNSQALMFGKFSEISTEVLTAQNGFEQSSNNINVQYSYHSNCRNHNNNLNVKHNGQLDKSRFKSKSKVLKIDPNPPNLLNGGVYDQLSQAIYDVFTSKAQTTDSYENKIEIWKNLFLYIRRCINHYALYIVGSTMTGFGLNSSDIDICLLIRPCTEDARLDSLHQLHHIKNHLLKYNVIIESELILAKVPILKFREGTKGFEVDLNCNNSVGIYNTHLLYCYARCDWRVRPLVIMVKLWAQANRINDAKNLTVSSYSWTLMLVHYLQCGVSPAVLPCLHSVYPSHFDVEKIKIRDVHEDLHLLDEIHSFNTQSLAELFIGFFGYYSNFDFNQYAISVRSGGRLLIENCKQVKAPKNDQHQWKYLCIEEPFDFTNTARSVYDIFAFRHIKAIITKSYEELVRTKLLNSVLPVTVNIDPIMPAY